MPPCVRPAEKFCLRKEEHDVMRKIDEVYKVYLDVLRKMGNENDQGCLNQPGEKFFIDQTY